jgi:hypothetical protein
LKRVEKLPISGVQPSPRKQAEMLMATEFPNDLVIANPVEIEVGNAVPRLNRRRNPVHGIALPFDVWITERKSAIAKQVEVVPPNPLCALDNAFTC